MSTKRILAAILGTLMLVALAVPALAYETPNTSLVADSAFTSKLTISGSSANFDDFGGVSTAPATKTATLSLEDEAGAWHLTNTGSTNTAYATGAKGTANTSNAYSQFVDNTAGMTVDLYAKFAELPTLATNDVMLDTGAPALNPNSLYFSGLVFNLCSAEKYMADTSKSNNEMQAIFATYYNDELGTDAVVFLPYGNRNAWATSSAAVTYFFDMPTDYARYTFTFDAVNETTQFFINGEAQVAAGDETAVHDAIALSYRATATTNFLNINLNNAQASVSDGGTGTDFYLDQLNVYPNALTPDAETNFIFNEEPSTPTNANFDNAYAYYRDFDAMADEYFNPTFWNAFEEYINYGLNIIANGTQEELNAIADSGTNGNWFINRFHFKSTAGINATTGGSAATVNGTGTVIPAATPVLLGYDKMWISHIDADGKDIGWTYTATLITADNVNTCTDVTSFGGTVASTYWRAYIFEPTAVEGYYTLVDVGGNASDRTTIPEGGCALLFHTNSKTNTTANTAAAEYNKYNSALFWARNVHAVYAAGLTKGGYVKFEGVDFANNTLDTVGTWLSYKDPALNGGAGDHVYRTGYIALDTADEQGRTTATRDAFAGFKTNAYVDFVDALPVVGEPITVTVKGEGTVTATVDGADVALDSISAETGSTVALTATGEGFKYWVGGNDAILSTEAVLSIPGGKALNITAVFEDADDAETYNVYFKDSKTGKVIATKSVEAGTALDTTDVTASMKGYTFTGWTVENGTVINATTEVYAVYEKDASSEVAVTIVRDGKSVVVNRAYGAIAAVSAQGENFSYWTLNGAVVSVNADFQFSTPSAACTLEAVYGAEAPVAATATVDASKVGSTIYYLMSRSVEEGAEIVETGVLMTRKATAADLTVDTTVNTVTRGVSSAADNYDVVGFRKDAEGKAGTWLVRGYLTYTVDGATSTIYTDVASIVIE